MTHRRVASTAVAVAIALLLAACGGSNPEEADVAGQVLDSESDDPVIESATSDGEPADTTTSSTTTTTTTTTTAAPTTTETPAVTRPTIEIPTSWDNNRDEIFGRYLLYFAAFDVALGPPFADPDDPRIRPILEDVLKPDALTDAVATIQSFQDDGIVVIQPEGSVAEHVLRVPKVQSLDKEEGHKVLIQDCWIRDYETQTPDGSFVEEIDDFRLFNATMEVVGGQWKLRSNIRQEPDDVGFDWCEQVASYR